MLYKKLNQEKENKKDFENILEKMEVINLEIKELKELIRVFGPDAKVKDVLNCLKLIVEMGQKLKAEGEKK